MTLEDKLKALIEAGGPVPLSAYMTACLHDPDLGYYATRPGLGTDFITAPETSQIFGELIGLWLVHEWRALGSPAPFTLCEPGPGRATMLNDALRAAKAYPDFLAAMRLTLIEASPAMRAVQAERLADHEPEFVADVSKLPSDSPALIVANEYLDCLPARQFIMDAGQWHERVVGLDQAGALSLGIAADTAPDAPQAVGGVIEVQPGLEQLVSVLSDRAAPFRALFVDYGPDSGPPGDSLRAYRQGNQVDPLSDPGACDLTVDVDFSRLAKLARAAGLSVAGPVSQGAFLGALGIQDRLNALIKAQPDRADTLFAGTQKLVDPAEMGTRFKAICLSSPGLASPAGL